MCLVGLLLFNDIVF